jgi:small subunit ribosomal protein S6
MRRYELMLLLRPDLEDDKLQASVEKVTRAIVNAGGSLSKVSPWGKRRLAYDIQRHREASYFLIHFDIEPSQVREIERGMLISEEILRHLVTVLEDRGPADELAPAATARASDDDDGSLGFPTESLDTAEPLPGAASDASEPAETAVATVSATEQDEVAEPAAASATDDAPSEGAAAVEPSDAEDDAAEARPADEEPAAG